MGTFCKSWQCWKHLGCVADSNMDLRFPRQRSEPTSDRTSGPAQTDLKLQTCQKNEVECSMHAHNKTASFPMIAEDELAHDRHFASFNLGNYSLMASKLWGETRVTLRSSDDKHNRYLKRELDILWNLKHPSILLLMGVMDRKSVGTISLVFEHVQLGSLHTWLHDKKKKVPTLRNCVDILLQVCDALIFIHSRGYVHCSVSSHAILLVNSVVSKLGRFEFAVRDNESPTARKLLPAPLKHDLHFWLSPEVIDGQGWSKASDIYSFCAVIWELCTGRVPWCGLTADELYEEVVSKGKRLPLDKMSMPPHLYQVMKEVLINREDLDLQEIRDMLLFTRRDIEIKDNSSPVAQGDGEGRLYTSRSVVSRRTHYAQHPAKHRAEVDKSGGKIGQQGTRHMLQATQPRNSVLSRSCIQLGRYGIDRYLTPDFSFVTHPAKREFLMSQPVSPERQGLYGRSMSSLYSCSEGVDLSSGESSPELRAISGSSSSCDSSSSDRDRKSSGAKSSDSGIQLARPSSGSEESGIRVAEPSAILRGVNAEFSQHQYGLPNSYRRKSALFASMRARRSCPPPSSRDRVWVGDEGSHRGAAPPTRGRDPTPSSHHSQTRSRSAPRSSRQSSRADYETGIKPASHRVANNTSSPAGDKSSSPRGSQKQQGRRHPPTTDNSVRVSVLRQNNAPQFKPSSMASAGKKVGASGSFDADHSVLYHTALESPGQELRCNNLASSGVEFAQDALEGEIAKKTSHSRKPVEPVIRTASVAKDTQSGGGKQGGSVRSIVNSLEVQRAASTQDAVDLNASIYRTPPQERNASNSNKAGPIIHPRPQKSTAAAAAASSKYPTSAERVSDLLRRPVPTTTTDLLRSVPPSSALTTKADQLPSTTVSSTVDVVTRAAKQHHRLSLHQWPETGDDVERRAANRRSLHCEQLQTILALRKANFGDMSAVSKGEFASPLRLAASEEPPQVHDQVEKQTARILKLPTQKAKLHTIRTSTPLDRCKSGVDAVSSQVTRQSAFQTALEEAGKDLSEESSAKTQTTRLSADSSGRENSPTERNSFSSYSRDSFDTVINASQSDMSFALTRTSPRVLLNNHTQQEEDDISGPHSIIQTEDTDLWQTPNAKMDGLPSALKNSPTSGEAGLPDGESPRKQSNEDSRSIVSVDLQANFDLELTGEQLRRSRIHSRMSTMSGRSSLSGASLPETEDLYCDDELHPSLENDPNMQLVCGAALKLQAFDNEDQCPIFETLDADSVLSMEIPSSGHQSLKSEYNTDTEYGFEGGCHNLAPNISSVWASSAVTTTSAVIMADSDNHSWLGNDQETNQVAAANDGDSPRVVSADDVVECESPQSTTIEEDGEVTLSDKSMPTTPVCYSPDSAHHSSPANSTAQTTSGAVLPIAAPAQMVM